MALIINDGEYAAMCTALGLEHGATIDTIIAEARGTRLALHRAQARNIELTRVRDAIQRDANIALEQRRHAVEQYKVIESRLLVRTAELDDVRDYIEKAAMRLGVYE